MSEDLLPNIVDGSFPGGFHKILADEGEETFQKKYRDYTGAEDRQQDNLVITSYGIHEHEPARHGFIQYDVVEDDLERPGFQQIHEHGGEKGEIRQDEPSPVLS
jgi:hypothetical protein